MDSVKSCTSNVEAQDPDFQEQAAWLIASKDGQGANRVSASVSQGKELSLLIM